MWKTFRLGMLLSASASAHFALAQEAALTHGPILGRLGSQEIGVWARTARPASFQVRYGLQPDKLDMSSAPVLTRLEHDNTGWAHITGLKANTEYYYRVATGGAAPQNGKGGSFRTLPDSADYRNPKTNPSGLFNFSFEYACGNAQRGRVPVVPTFKTMLDRLKGKIHFAILNGDWIYEEQRQYSVEQWLGQVGIDAGQKPPLLDLTPSITGVWENYKLYLRRDERLAAWHREIPSFFVIDDHEILGDVNGTGTPGFRNRRAVFRDIGVRAWYDYLAWSNPVAHKQGIHYGRAQLQAGSDVLTDPQADFTHIDFKEAANLHVHWGGQMAGTLGAEAERTGDANAGVYDVVNVLDKNRLRIRPTAKADGTPAYSIGRRNYFRMRASNCDFFVLDTRSHRELHDIKNPAKPGVSMLGRVQKEWLMEGMKASDADFLFVVSSVNFMIRHVSPRRDASGALVGNKDEAWTAYLDEREKMIRFWDSLGKPVLVLTGDLHNSFAIKITDRVWEFASGPHTSPNHTASHEDNRPPNGTYDSMGRKSEIRWSTYLLDDMKAAHVPVYTVVQVRNVFNNPADGRDRWVAFPRPHVIFQYYDGITGELLYAEPVHAAR